MINDKSLVQRIKAFLERNKGVWFNVGELERKGIEIGFLGSTVSRRLRELAEEGSIERQERNGNRVRSVWYRAI